MSDSIKLTSENPYAPKGSFGTSFSKISIRSLPPPLYPDIALTVSGVPTGSIPESTRGRTRPINPVG